VTTPDPEANPADVAEQAATEPAAPRPGALPETAPEADVLEQISPAGPGQHRVERDAPLEADDLDAAEQSVVVEDDEDEHR
jgi:hypothetical protein